MAPGTFQQERLAILLDDVGFTRGMQYSVASVPLYASRIKRRK